MVLVIAGLAWIATLSSLNAAMQLSLPAWVRARGLAAYLLVEHLFPAGTLVPAGTDIPASHDSASSASSLSGATDVA